jgi:hypothetical protein
MDYSRGVEKNKRREIGKLLFVTVFSGTVFALFATKDNYCRIPVKIDLKEDNVVFFDQEMIDLCTRHLLQQPRQALLSVEDSLYRLSNEVQLLRLSLNKPTETRMKRSRAPVVAAIANESDNDEKTAAAEVEQLVVHTKND